LNPGSYFGELSLIYNAPRTATVTSCDRCDLVVISRYAYEKIIRQYHIDQMDKMITFYMNFPLFEEMSKELVFTIVTRSRYSKVSSKETVVR
jgi:CRP-like cAMP-binding protein